jgi:hypothetical protein
MLEPLDILGDQETAADLRQSREDFAAGDTYTAAQVRADFVGPGNGIAFLSQSIDHLFGFASFTGAVIAMSAALTARRLVTELPIPIR